MASTNQCSEGFYIFSKFLRSNPPLISSGRCKARNNNEEAVIQVVTDAGFDPYEKKLLGITAMQKRLGKSRFDELLTAYIEKPQGKPTLVLKSDKRPAMNNAKTDFMEEI